MGIERFFSSIEENDITNLKTSFTKTLEHKIDAQYLYVDFNSIVYITSFKVLSSLNYMLFQIISNKYKNNEKYNTLKKEYDLPSDNINSFKKQYTENKINEIIINKIVEYVSSMLSNYIDPNKLEYFYIAIDGVPSKSKIVEQKKRRYMGGIINEIKKKIFDKYELKLEKDKIRYQFEKNKIGWNTNFITPGTEFMHELNIVLKSDKFKKMINKTCPKLKSYIFSGVYEPGEGEKKIVDHLRSLKQEQSNYVIYSPDSDVTLLGLLLNTNRIYNSNKRRVSKLKLIRHNQQKHNYDIVDIDQLADNIFKYVQDKLKTGKLNKDNVIDDIVLLLTIFGNDFVPKIESFNVAQDFSNIIDKYISVLDENFQNEKINYIISYSDKKNKKVINHKVLLQIFKELQTDEGGNLQKVYMSSHYQNYNKLKKIMDVTSKNFTPVMITFLSTLRNFNSQVRNVNKDNVDELIEHWTKTDDNSIFIGKLKRLTRLDSSSDIRSISDDDFIRTYAEYYIRQNKLPKVAVNFRRYSKTLQNQFHKTNLEKSLDYLDPNLKITEYDEEIYKFDNMLDEYTKGLNAYSLNLGYVGVDPNTYTWKTEKIQKSVQKYYNEFFGIDDINIKNPKMKALIQDYIDGLIWVFEFYFNQFDIKENRDLADIWHYKYTHAPLLTQIYHFLKSKENESDYYEKITDRLYKSKVNRKDYFNCIEHLMYVSPVTLGSIKNIVPDEYRDFIKKSDYYYDVNKVVDAVWKGDTHYIDCKGVLFLNKCHLEIPNFMQDFEQDKKFIKEIRKIKLKKSTTDRACDISSKVIKSKKSTGGKYSEKDMHWVNYKKAKDRYLKTGEIVYKGIYKEHKYMYNLLKN
jgi:5'-3' exonuclease